MDKTPRIDYTIKTSASDEVFIEEFRCTTETIRLMLELQNLAHPDIREESNA